MEFGEKMLCISNHMQMVSEQSDVNSGRSSNSNNNNNNNNNNPTFAWYSSSSWQPSVSNNNHSNNSSLGLFNNAFHTAAEATSPHRQAHPDPHLTCLKLGKRHYFEDSSSSSNVDGGVAPPLRGEKSGGTGVARCQVEGCEVALAKSKEYHRRHKVCEMHSKAPIVVVLGRDQRFCQQCSRFHVVSEFDESKRSCRRRLAGHNERRRKNAHHSQHQHQHQHQHSTSLSVATNNSTQGGCALSLLSAGGAGGSESWLSHHSDLSIRCSAALHELIAENRAALLITSRHHLHLHDTDHDSHLNHPQWDQRHY